MQGAIPCRQLERFYYDPQGNRIHKKNNSQNDSSAYYYVRDAGGNILSMYNRSYKNINNQYSFIQKEIIIFGSSRLGTYEVPLRDMNTGDQISGKVNTRYRNYRRYESSNHLGNVMTVMSDRLRGNPINGQQKVNNYVPDIVAANDYYPFGQVMYQRNYPIVNGKNGFFTKYRYGFNDKESDSEGEVASLNTYDYGFRIYTPSIGRFLSADPLTATYPMLSPYQFSSNSPIANIDREGLESAFAADGKYIGSGLEVANLKNASFVYYSGMFKAPGLVNNSVGVNGKPSECFIPPVGYKFQALEKTAEAATESTTAKVFEKFGSYFTKTAGLLIGAMVSFIPSANAPGINNEIEKISTDGAILNENDYSDIRQRIINRTASLNDYIHADEAFKRGIGNNMNIKLVYKASDKHKIPNNPHISFMDLTDPSAQKLLNNSIESGKQRYGYSNGKIYEFQPDNAGTYHGYPIPGNQAGTEVLKDLRDRGDFDQKTYNKLVKQSKL